MQDPIAVDPSSAGELNIVQNNKLVDGADELGGGDVQLGGLQEGGELDEVGGEGGVAGRELGENLLEEGAVGGGGMCHLIDCSFLRFAVGREAAKSNSV